MTYHRSECILHLFVDEDKKAINTITGIRVHPFHLLTQSFIDLLAGLRPEFLEVPAPECCTIRILARQAVIPVEVEVVAS